MSDTVNYSRSPADTVYDEVDEKYPHKNDEHWEQTTLEDYEERKA